MSVLTFSCCPYSYYGSVDGFIRSGFCQEEGLIRKISDIIKTSVRNRFSVYTLVECCKCDFIFCCNVDHHLCCCTTERCGKLKILGNISTIEDNLCLSANCLLCLCIHEEVLRSSLRCQTCEMEVSVLLFHSDKLIIILYCGKCSLCNIAVCHQIDMIRNILAEIASWLIYGQTRRVVDLISSMMFHDVRRSCVIFKEEYINMIDE